MQPMYYIGLDVHKKWKDVDFAAKHLSVTRSIVSQVVGVCKTEASQKPVPLHESLAQALLEWRRHTSFPQA